MYVKFDKPFYHVEPENLGIQYFIGKQTVADRLIKEIRRVDWR